MTFTISIIPDSDGWYAEVWETSSGETVHLTSTFPRKGDSIISARRWIRQRRGAVDLIQ